MRRKLLTVKKIFLLLTVTAGILCAATGIIKINTASGDYSLTGTARFIRVEDDSDHSDETVCAVEFISEDGKYTLTAEYPYDEWEALPQDASVEGYIYSDSAGNVLTFTDKASPEDIRAAEKNVLATDNAPLLGAAMACLLIAAGLFVTVKWDSFFTAYEQTWFLSILVLAGIFSLIFPEEEVNGVNGLVIMALYLADTILNILCELLISKQSKWNFIVSVFVELTEIAICAVLAYRFATLASTLFFWLPCDIISFINWHKHPDKQEDELTEVRSLKGWQELLIVLGIIVWTAGVGFLLTTLDFGTDLFGGNRTLEVIVCFIDACASAVGVVNGIFILLRLREQWIAWYICAVLEGVINVLSGQYVLLILKLGYITNTTYGYIRWTRYIRSNSEEVTVKK